MHSARTTALLGRWATGPLALVLLAACSERSANAPVLPAALEPVPIARPDPARLATRQILHRGNGAQPEGLDPHLTQSVPSDTVQRDLFEGLTTEAADGRIVPGAAESWEVDDEGRTYTFRLRANARWSNGEPLTADDWVYSLRRSVDPATGSRYALILAPIRHAEAIVSGQLPPDRLGVQARSRHLLEIELEAPTPYFLALLAHNAAYPVHRPSIEAHGDAYGRPGNLVGNGAYRATEAVVGSHITLVRNPYFHDAANVVIEQVVYHTTDNLAAELARYRSDQLDWTYEVPSAQLGEIARQFGDELRVAPYLGIYYYGFNTTRAPFDDVRVRRALAMSIERERITEQVMGVQGTASHAFVPDGIPGYRPQQPSWAAWTQQQRDAEAQRLLAEAGFGRGRPLRIEIRYNTHDDHRRIALAVASMWQHKLDVEARLLNEEFRVFLANRRQRQLTQVYRGGWIGDFLDPYSFLALARSDNPQNDAGWSHPEFDALLAASTREVDAAKRLRLLERAESILVEEAPHAPLYRFTSKRLVKPWVKGWHPNPLDHHGTRWMWIERHPQRP